MRLMIGTNGNPSLLVTVEQEKSPNEFDFRVVNGLWEGTFTNGYVTVYGAPGGAFSSLDKNQILCNCQDRLRGSYQDVFDNFHNVDYVAPVPNRVVFDDMDDDIPF